MDQRVTDYLAKVSAMYRGVMEKAFANVASPRQAIKAKCLACCNFDRKEVEHCTTVLCPLHGYRPYQKGSL